jgi:hypothetical protein
MKEKLQQFTRFALVLGVLSSLVFGSVYTPAYAQNEESRILNDIGEGADRVLSSDWVELAPGEQHTFSFAYDGGEQPITVWMDLIPTGGAIFQVWTDERIAQASEDPTIGPVGTGTAITEGAATTSWQGTSPGAETYHVIVSSTGDVTSQYMLNISSPALALVQPGTDPNLIPDIAVVTTDTLNVRAGPSMIYPVIMTALNGAQLTVVGRNATNTWIAVQLDNATVGWVSRVLTNYTGIAPIAATPPAPQFPTPEPGIGAVPGQNVPLSEANAQAALENNWQVLHEGESRWYTFRHQGDGLPVQIWMDADPNEGAGFRVFSEENAMAVMAGSAPDDVDDIGRGTSNPDEAGDLFWRGEFEEAGTFYVLIEHGWQGDVFYSLYSAGLV